ncbi:MAG: hypothetical protein ACXVCY_18505 [Pseudobdellovibrionaceae bacterium]
MFLEKYPKSMAVISWMLNLMVLCYFAYLSWWASVDFNGFTSMLFGIPVLAIFLVCAYLSGRISGKKVHIGRFSKYVSQLMCVVLVLFYLSGFFPTLQKFSEFPIKVSTRLSKKFTGKTPDQWINQ